MRVTSRASVFHFWAAVNSPSAFSAYQNRAKTFRMIDAHGRSAGVCALAEKCGKFVISDFSDSTSWQADLSVFASSDSSSRVDCHSIDCKRRRILVCAQSSTLCLHVARNLWRSLQKLKSRLSATKIQLFRAVRLDLGWSMQLKNV